MAAAGLAVAGLVASALALASASSPAHAQLTGGRPVSLPAPSASLNNPAKIVAPPAGFSPRVPPGFVVSVFASGFAEPRWLAVAPSGDLFVADSAAGRIVVLHDPERAGTAQSREIFADGLAQPFGIAFRGGFVYVAEQDGLDRFRFDAKTSRRLSAKERLRALPPAVAVSGPNLYPHWTRALAFSRDGSRLFVSVGTKSNLALDDDPQRALIEECDPDARACPVFARGLRNAVGIAVHPQTGRLWAAVNERGGLGDDVPPDYLTEVRRGGFYGFPFAYVGAHEDARVRPRRPDLVAKALVPDLLLTAHASPLQLVFYEGRQFPAEFWHGAFMAEHGSTNRSHKVGYDVVFVPFRAGRPVAPARPFVSGFVPDPARAEAYGRPVGVAVAADGALLFSDDGGNRIWRVAYAHRPRP